MHVRDGLHAALADACGGLMTNPEVQVDLAPQEALSVQWQAVA